MAFETRGNGSYYYRKERENGRVRSVYVGNGETARLIAMLDAAYADERETKREVERAKRAEIEAHDAALDELSRLADAVAAGVLLVAGFHTHKRQWRRYYGLAYTEKKGNIATGDDAKMTNKSATLTTTQSRDDKQISAEFIALVSSVNTGKPKPADVEKIKRMMSDHDDLKLWQHFAGLAESCELTMLEFASCVPAGLAILWSERQAEMRQDLGCGDAPDAEKYLISHVALCYLRLMIVEFQLTLKLSGDHNINVGVYMEKRLTDAQKRYTRAVETLAKVRTLSAATRLIESRTAAASAARSVNSLRAMKLITE